jgi:hypothetical protein
LKTMRVARQATDFGHGAPLSDRPNS